MSPASEDGPPGTLGGALFARFGDEVSTREVAAGQSIIRHGKAPDGLYRVVTGRFEASVRQRGRTLVLGVLGPGDVVGEISLLAGGLSTATVTAVVDAVVAFVPGAVARGAVDEDPHLVARLSADAVERVDHNALVQLLAEFTDLTEAGQIARAIDELELRRLRSGEELFHQGDPGDSAFLVVSGGVAVVDEHTDGTTTERTRIGRGQLLGEAALFDRQARLATAVAVRDTVVAEMDGDTYQEMLCRNPVTMARFTRQMVERMARPGRRDRRVVSAIAVATTCPRVNSRVVATRVAEALEPFGSVAHLTAARVDADLEVPGIADSGQADPAHARLVAHLHEVEVAHEVTILEVDRRAGEWCRTAVGAADRVMLVVSATPDAEERRAVAELMGACGSTTSVVAVAMHPDETLRPTGSAALRATLGVDRLLHARSRVRGDLDRATRITASRAVGLVLGGGGARGFAHVGVHRVLRERGIPVDVMVGSSIGAPIGGGMATMLEPDEFVPRLRALFAGLLDYTVPVVSLVKGERITHSIEVQFGGWDFEDSWTPFVCVSTNLTHSRTQVHRSGPMSPAVRASVAIPGVLPPVPDGEDLLVDGGVLNNLPVDVLADEGVCGTIIAVDVAPPTGPRAHADYGLSVSGWRALRASVGRKRSGYPGISAVLMRSMLVGSQRDRARVLVEADVDLLLELDLRGVGLLEFDVVDPVVERGAELAAPLVDAWLAGRPWAEAARDGANGPDGAD